MNLRWWLEKSFWEFPDHVAVVNADSSSASYRQLRDRSNKIAHVLASQGVSAGDVVVSAMPDDDVHVATFYAALGLGAAFSGLNYKVHTEKLVADVACCRAEVAVVAPQYLELGKLLARQPTIRSVLVTTGPDATFARLDELCANASSELRIVDRRSSDIAAVNFTSGTSGAGEVDRLVRPEPLPGISMDPVQGAALLRTYIESACELTDKPFAVNIPVGSAENGEVLPFSAAYVSAVVAAVKDPFIASRLRVITTSAGPPGVVRKVIEGSGLIHMHKVGGTRQAIRARAEGVDVIIASGYEAGGHTHARPVHTFVLAPSIAAAVDCPVVVAGGVKDGATMAAAFALGAGGVAMGTRFVASHDNPDWHPAYAQRIVDAREGEDITFLAIYGPSRALPSRGITELEAVTRSGTLSVAELTAWKDERLIIAQRDGNLDPGILPAGQVSGAIADLIHVADFVPAMAAEAVAILDRLHARIRPVSS